MKKYLHLFREHYINISLVLGLILLLTGGAFFVNNLFGRSENQNGPIQEMDVTFDPEGPYILLVPRKDGNALYITFKRISTYDEFSYAIAYTDKEGIDRGAGDLETWIPIEKGRTDYEQEILFGTCSKNVCKYDEGVENGTLVVRIKKGNKVSKISSKWHLQQPDIALGNLTSGDNHFSYKTTADRQLLAITGFSIINDITGAPKLPDGKEVRGFVYALNVPLARKMSSEGEIIMELAEDPGSEAKIARYSEAEGKWTEYETKNSSGTLTAKATGEGIYAVLAPKK